MSDGLPDCPSSHGHDWKTLMAHVGGRGHFTTEVQEMCRDCDIIRLSPDRQVFKPTVNSTMTARVKGDAWEQVEK